MQLQIYVSETKRGERDFLAIRLISLLIFADMALIHRPTTTTTSCIAVDFHDNGEQMVENAEFVETLGIQRRYVFQQSNYTLLTVRPNSSRTN